MSSLHLCVCLQLILISVISVVSSKKGSDRRLISEVLFDVMIYESAKALCLKSVLVLNIYVLLVCCLIEAELDGQVGVLLNSHSFHLVV